MAPFNTFVAGTWNKVTYNADVVSNSTISDFTFSLDQKTISFNAIGLDGSVGFCRVSIPKQLLWVGNPQEWIVLVGFDPVVPKVTEDADHAYLYFTYTQSTQIVRILGTTVVPEFPSTIILPLLMALTMLAIIFSERRIRRKHKT